MYSTSLCVVVALTSTGIGVGHFSSHTRLMPQTRSYPIELCNYNNNGYNEHIVMSSDIELSYTHDHVRRPVGSHLAVVTK